MNNQNNAATLAAAALFQRDLVILMPQLRAFARTMCQHRELGEDMAQEALTKAWRARGHFEAGTNLRAWLFTILRNEFHSHRRRAWRQTQWDDVKGGRIATASDEQLWALKLSDTARALRQLPDSQREAVILVGAGGFSYDEAAKICDTKVGTVKSRVGRGRAAMVRMLDGDQDIPAEAAHPEVIASNPILAQLSALMPAGAHSAAYA